jgi:hypothetical protein
VLIFEVIKRGSDLSHHIRKLLFWSKRGWSLLRRRRGHLKRMEKTNEIEGMRWKERARNKYQKNLNHAGRQHTRPL